MNDEVVKLTEVGSELEASMICGLLESNGIRTTYDKGSISTGTAVSSVLDSTNTGRQEILVQHHDLERARELLAATVEK